MNPIRLTVVLLVGAIIGCTPTTPEGYPVVTGVYGGSLSGEFTSVPGGVKTTGGPCGSTLTFTSQRASDLEGRFERGFPCARGTYPLKGSVERNGRLTVDVTGIDAYQGFKGCRYRAGDERWRGEVRGDELSLSIDVLLACEEVGEVQTHGTITARRAPDNR